MLKKYGSVDNTLSHGDNFVLHIIKASFSTYSISTVISYNVGGTVLGTVS